MDWPFTKKEGGRKKVVRVRREEGEDDPANALSSEDIFT